MEVAEDPMASPDDRCRLTFDEVTIRVTVAGEDGIDDGSFTWLIVRSCGRRNDVYGLTPTAGMVVLAGWRDSALLHDAGGRAEPSVARLTAHLGSVRAVRISVAAVVAAVAAQHYASA